VIKFSASEIESKKEIPVALPFFDKEEIRAVQETILSGWVTQGPKVKDFEAAFAAYVGAPYACAVSNCTAALHLGLLAVGVKPGDVVLTVSHSYIATANAIRHCQAEPVFVDIDPTTFNMDPAQVTRCLERDFDLKGGVLWYKDVARLVTDESPLHGRLLPLGRLAAILVVHQIGLPADLNEILPCARQYGIPVVEDAACAVGTEISRDGGNQWEKIGFPHGDVACFSFHPRKIMTTGDGGMLTTRNLNYDRKFRLWRQHGMSLSDLDRHTSGKVTVEEYVTTGYNYRMTDIQASMGIEQLKRLPQFVPQRRTLASAYGKLLSGLKGLRIPSEPAYAKSTWQSYMVCLKEEFSRRQVMQQLKINGINTRRGVMCAHLEPPYAKAWPKGCLPHSEAVQQKSLVLPLYHSMEEGSLQKIANALEAILSRPVA